jgi:competence protein ComEA
MDDGRRKLETAGWAIAAFVVVLLGMRTLDRAEAEPPGKPVVREQRAAKRERVVVAVAGEVRRPGIVRVRAGARIDVAIRRAGGLTRQGDPTAVNLAARLQDGQQIVIPRHGAAAGGAAAGTGAEAPISLSSATVEQLDTIDGIGPTLAQRIVDYRTEHGGFHSIEELQEVDGIGEARFETLREALQP